MRLRIINGAVSYGAETVLEEINFEINNKDKIAVVGRNGCGKTTLLKALINNDMIEEGIGEYANPSSIIKAAEMMLRHILKTDAADKLSEALRLCDEEKRVVVTGNTDGNTCSEFADYVMEKLEGLNAL